MSKPIGSILAALVLGLPLAAPLEAPAQPQGAAPATPAPAAAPADAGPVVKTEPIPHATGGVAQVGQERMKAMHDQYNMHLTFAQGKEGAYLADVKVRIADAKGATVLETVAGPMLFAKLPAGTYRVSAEVAGETRSQTIRVGGKAARSMVIRFPG